MPRAAAVLDPFQAVAEPRRRQMLGLLAGGERQVNEIVVTFGWPQPQVSKHLAALLEVGLVNVRRDGRRRLYRVNGEQLKMIHDWTATFERFWQTQLEAIKERAEAAAKKLPESNHPKPPTQEPS